MNDTTEIDTGCPKILARIENGTGWLTFNNPDRRNAVSIEMWEAVAQTAERFASDDAVRVVVLTGAGEKAFVSGADISQFEEKRANAEAGDAYTQISENARMHLAAIEKPVIAMIRGFCVGGGIGVAMKVDIRICSDDSRFGIPAAKLGLAYAYESLRALTHLVGPAYAKEILFTGRLLSADEALRIGLVNKVVPAGELEASVRAYCDMITANAPLTIKASKVTIEDVLKDPDKRNFGRIHELKSACMDSEDYTEGRRAFMEKRKPQFKGR